MKTLLTALTLMISLFAAEPTTAPESGPLHVFLLMGQSNMAGYGCAKDTDPWQPGDKEPVPGVLMLMGEATHTDAKAKDAIEWKPAAHPLHRRQGHQYFGMGMDFAKSYLATHPGVRVGLIPCAWGGAPIAKLNKGSPIYMNALQRAEFARKDGSTIQGILWHQGESDTVTPALADAYAKNLDQLITDLRTDLALPQLPFIAGELAQFYGTGKDHKAPDRVARITQVRRAILDLPTRVPHTAAVPSTDMKSADQNMVHFNRAAFALFGRRYAEAFNKITRKPVNRPADYQLVFEDNFDGTTLDTSKWGFPGYKKREAALVNTEGTITVSDGLLKLNAFQREGELHCAIIDTRGKFDRAYGWYETRMKMHKLQGMHSCFWVQTPTFNKFPNDPAQSGTEMDIMEWFGSGRRSGWAGMNVYYRGEKSSVRSPSIPDFSLMGGPSDIDPKRPLGDMSADFHAYAMHWTPDFCAYYCDGIEIMRDTKAVSHVPQYIVLSLLSSNWERPKLDLTKLPDALTVDYVRVYAPETKE